MSHQSYLLVKLELEGETDRSAEYTTQNITSALKVLFGETGAADHDQTRHQIRSRSSTETEI